ncbi:MAG TPA: PAS domain S-box protein [Candidatus Limnocylindrales bacterium]
MAMLVLDRDGRYLDASPAALDLIGVGLDELRALPPNALTPEEEVRDADGLEEAWIESREPDLYGHGTLRRPDGRRVAVAFAVSPKSDGTFVALLRPDDRQPGVPRLYTAGEALAAWRAAERRLEVVTPGTEEYADLAGEIESFRNAYHGAFDRRLGRSER